MGSWPLVPMLVLVGAAVVLLFAGSKFTRIVDLLADRTGIGEALAGGVLLGATTSLPGLITTLIGASEGQASFAMSNAVGGIAAQTTFLVVADLSYRRANLEHAAASVPNMMQATLLIALVGLVLVGAASPEVTIGPLHPVSPMILLCYLYGLHLSRRAHQRPMWSPRQTKETLMDHPEEEAKRRSLLELWGKFFLLGVLVSGAGWAVARAGLSTMSHTGLSGSFVGAIFTAVITSLPELVTAIVAVRAGALTLAVGDIIGGNTFDVLMVPAADALLPGSIYHAVDRSTLFVVAETLVLASVLAAGLLHREERGIGFEGLAILVLYVTGAVVLGVAF